MKKYKSNFYVTIGLIVATAILYICKNVKMIPDDIKLFAYLMLISLNLLIFFKTLSCAKPLNSLLAHKLSGENAKAKVGFLINIVKCITRLELKFILGAIVVIFAIVLQMVLYVLEYLGVDIYRLADVILDMIAVMSLSNTYLQLHINYSICKYLTEEK